MVTHDTHVGLRDKLLQRFFELLQEIYLLALLKGKFLPQLISKNENKYLGLGLK